MTIIDFSCYRLHKLIQLKYLYSSNAMVSLKCDTFKQDLKMQLISHHPSLARSLALGFAYEPVIGPRAVLISQFRSNGVPNERVVLIDPSQLFNKYLNAYYRAITRWIETHLFLIKQFGDDQVGFKRDERHRFKTVEPIGELGLQWKIFHSFLIF